MSHRTLLAIALVGTLVAALVLVLTGCGHDGRLASAGPGGGADAQFYLDLSGPLGPNTQGLPDRKAPITSPREEPSHSVMATIDGAAGGQIALERFVLSFPPGAFEGSRQITLESVQNGFVECRLFPEGLVFNVPVVLTMDLSNTSCDGTDATIYWYDPGANHWVDLSGAYLATDHKVSVPLRHFCTYRAGRAGW